VPDTQQTRNPDYRVVGTAGHIDHGKSTLVRALTGTDPDRLSEEKARGITIDLGFADAMIEDLQVGFVDVPGHERFVKNMLAGVGSIDAVLLVVAADESVMPQTREHVAICDLLGISRGVVALTKCDLVEEELAELVELEVIELLSTTRLQGAPIVRTAGTDDAGLERLRSALAAVLRDTSRSDTESATRLPVDRVFTVRGFGTVVTGTLLGEELAVGAQLEALPGGAETTVRGIQVHGSSVERAHGGQRVALNLPGIDVDELRRGDILAPVGELRATSILDVHVRMLPGCELEHLQRVRFHHGAAELLARVALLDTQAVAAGGSAYAQLRLERPYPALPGDLAILRRYSPITTIGGATILDTHPPKRRRQAGVVEELQRFHESDDEARLQFWIGVAGAGAVSEKELRQRLGRSSGRFDRARGRLLDRGCITPLAGGLLAASGELTRLGESLVAKLAAYHEAHPLHIGMPRRELRNLAGDRVAAALFDAVLAGLEGDAVTRSIDGEIALARHTVAIEGDTATLQAELLAAFDTDLAPPTPEAVLAGMSDPAAAEDLLRLALREERLVRIADEYIVAAATLEKLIANLHDRLSQGDRFSVSDFKAWTGLSRRHSIPMLEHLDRQRITRREGDSRILV
jgi:selenocysteine-specific elongation factor